MNSWNVIHGPLIELKSDVRRDAVSLLGLLDALLFHRFLLFLPGVDNLKTSLISLLDDNLIDCIVYKQWTSVDRSTLETVSQPADEFVDLSAVS